MINNLFWRCYTSSYTNHVLPNVISITTRTIYQVWEKAKKDLEGNGWLLFIFVDVDV